MAHGDERITRPAGDRSRLGDLDVRRLPSHARDPQPSGLEADHGRRSKAREDNITGAIAAAQQSARRGQGACWRSTRQRSPAPPTKSGSLARRGARRDADDDHRQGQGRRQEPSSTPNVLRATRDIEQAKDGRRPFALAERTAGLAIDLAGKRGEARDHPGRSPAARSSAKPSAASAAMRPERQLT